MARTDCPYCGGRKMFRISGSNIEIHCDYCNPRGEIPRPDNYDTTKEPRGVIARITDFFSWNNGA